MTHNAYFVVTRVVNEDVTFSAYKIIGDLREFIHGTHYRNQLHHIGDFFELKENDEGAQFTVIESGESRFGFDYAVFDETQKAIKKPNEEAFIVYANPNSAFLDTVKELADNIVEFTRRYA